MLNDGWFLQAIDQSDMKNLMKWGMGFMMPGADEIKLERLIV